MKKLKTMISIFSIILFFCMSITAQSSKVKQLNLCDSTKVELLFNSLKNKEIQDSSVWDIDYIEDESKGYGTPDFDFILESEQYFSILLLDKDKNLIKIILHKFLKQGHYRIYLKNEIIYEYLMDPKIIFYFLIKMNNKYVYKKSILIK